MIYLYVVFVLAVVCAAILGIVEQRRHVARLRQFGTRVIVLGDEKNDVVRACALALSAGPGQVAARTKSGSLVLPGAAPRLEPYPAGAAVRDRKSFVRAASDSGAESFVVDALSRNVSLVREDRKRLVAADVAIIQPDDGGIPGWDAIRAAVPDGGLCLTTDEGILERLEPLCAERRGRCVLVEVGSLSRPVALAITLAQERGISREAAVDAVESARWPS